MVEMQRYAWLCYPIYPTLRYANSTSIQSKLDVMRLLVTVAWRCRTRPSRPTLNSQRSSTHHYNCTENA